MSKKGNNVIGILVSILGISLIFGVVVISFFQKGSNENYFKKQDRVFSEKVFESLINLNEDNYPDTPEDLVFLYTNTYRLLYGDKIKNFDVLPIILEKQRMLFSKQLLENNPLEEQILRVKKNLEFLSENKMKIINTYVKDVTYDKNNGNIAYVNVIKQDNLFESYYYKYYLQKYEDKKWKITGWYNTDEKFNIK